MSRMAIDRGVARDKPRYDEVRNERVRGDELRSGEPDGATEAKHSDDARLRDELRQSDTRFEEQAHAPLTDRPTAPTESNLGRSVQPAMALKRGLANAPARTPPSTSPAAAATSRTTPTSTTATTSRTSTSQGTPPASYQGRARFAEQDRLARARLDDGGVGAPRTIRSPGAASESRRANSSAARSSSTAALTASEAHRLGSAYADGKTRPHQQLWTPAGVGMTLTRATEQKLHSSAAADKTGGIAHSAVYGDQAETDASAAPKKLDEAQMAAMVRDAGVPLERIDPNQLSAAASFVNGAKDAGEQVGRLHQALDTFKVNDRGSPELSKDDVNAVLWDAARVPAHAMANAKDPAQTYQEVARSLNTPGEHKLKVGKHNLKLTVGENHDVISTKTSKPSGFLSALKKVGSLALTAASFIPGPVGIAARVASSVVSAVRAAKNGSVFGAIAGAAGAVAGGFGALARGATSGVASTVAKISDKVAMGARGVQSAMQVARGEGIGAIAGAVAGTAGAFAGIVGSAAEGASNAARSIEKWANRGASAANTVEAARRGDLLGAAAGATSLGAGVVHDLGNGQLASKLGTVSGYAATASTVERSVRSGDYLGAGGALGSFAATKVGDPVTKQRLDRAATGLTAAGGVVDAVKRDDFTAALTNGTRLAASLTDNKDLHDGAAVAAGVDALARAVRSNDPRLMTDAAHRLRDLTGAAANRIRERHAPAPELLPSRPLNSALAGLPPGLTPPGLTPSGLIPQAPSTGAVANPPGIGPDGRPLLGFESSVTVTAADPRRAGVGPDGQPLLRFNDSVSVTAMAPGGPLRRGRTGEEVAQLQRDLISAGYGKTVGAADGVFGPNTEAALKEFQAKGLRQPTGQLDASTREGLSEQLRYNDEARRLHIQAQGRVDVVRASVRDFQQLSVPGAMLSQGLKDWEKSAGDLQRLVDNGASNAQLSRQLQEVDKRQRNVESFLQGRDRELAALGAGAQVVKSGADLVIKAFGPPWLKAAYSGLSAGAAELASSGSLRDAFTKAAAGAGASAIGGSASSVGQAAARGFAQEAVRAGGDAIVEMQRIRTSDPAEARRQAEDIIQRTAARTVSTALYNGSLHPFLDGVSPSSPQGRALKAAAEEALKKTLRDRLLPTLLGGG